MMFIAVGVGAGAVSSSQVAEAPRIWALAQATTRPLISTIR
jgi:hypothetical protein